MVMDLSADTFTGQSWKMKDNPSWGEVLVRSAFAGIVIGLTVRLIYELYKLIA